jgi:hypothetical protein
MFKDKFGNIVLMGIGFFILFVLIEFVSAAGRNKVDDSFVNGHSVNLLIEDYAKKEITPAWFDFEGTVTDIQITDVEAKKIIPDEGSKTLLKVTAIIKGTYIPDFGTNKGTQTKFKITKEFHVDTDRLEVRLLD